MDPKPLRSIIEFHYAQTIKTAILIVATVLVSNLAFAYHIKYTFINKTDAAQPYIHVVMNFQTGNRQTTLLDLPLDWAGQTELYNCIKNLKSESANCRIDTTKNKAERLLIAGLKTEVTLSYDLVPDYTGEIVHSKYFRPIIKADCFYFLGINGLIIPDTAKKEKLAISIKWNGFDKKTLVSSFGAQNAAQKFATDYDHLQMAVFAGGNLRLQPVLNKTNRILIAAYGKFKFTDDGLNTFVNKVINNESNFWNDKTCPYYLVTVFPCYGDLYGGTGYTNSFSVFYRTDKKIEEGLVKLMYHECFHRWNGQLIRHADNTNEFACYWFTEGFTEYYAQKLIVNDGLQSQDDNINYINSVLQNLYLSPARNADNHKIETSFWTDFNVQMLPYQRGYLFALLCDNRILRQTKGAYSLDNVMRDILNQAKKDTLFSQEVFLKAVAKYDGSDYIPRQLNKIIINGEDFVIDSVFDSGRYTLKYNDVTRVNPGFDLKLSQKNKKITGLKGTNAEKAGLKEGMEITGNVSIWGFDPTKEIKIQVTDGETFKWIIYFPDPVKPVSVPYITKN